MGSCVLGRPGASHVTSAHMPVVPGAMLGGP